MFAAANVSRRVGPQQVAVGVVGDLGDGRERGGCARVGNDDVDAAEVVDRPRE
jgi:hypothetical protein